MSRKSKNSLVKELEGINCPFYSVNQSLKYLGISRAFIYKEIGIGSIKAHKLGGKTIFLIEDLNSYISSLPRL